MGTSVMQIFQSLVRVLKAYDYCIAMILRERRHKMLDKSTIMISTTISKDGQRLDRLLMLS